MRIFALVLLAGAAYQSAHLAGTALGAGKTTCFWLGVAGIVVSGALALLVEITYERGRR